MKERSVKVKVRPKRLTRAERKRIKRSQKADAQLALCRQAIEFHKAYLAIEMEYARLSNSTRHTSLLKWSMSKPITMS